MAKQIWNSMLPDLTAGVRSENGSWVPVLKWHDQVIWNGFPCRNRDETTQWNIAARDVARVLLWTLTGQPIPAVVELKMGRYRLRKGGETVLAWVQEEAAKLLGLSAMD